MNEIFKEYGIGDGSYHKNYEDIYNMVNIYDGVNTAIRKQNAECRSLMKRKISHHSLIPEQQCMNLLKN